MFAAWCVFGVIGAAFALVGAVCAVWAPVMGTVALAREMMRRVNGSAPGHQVVHAGR